MLQGPLSHFGGSCSFHLGSGVAESAPGTELWEARIAMDNPVIGDGGRWGNGEGGRGVKGLGGGGVRFGHM